VKLDDLLVIVVQEGIGADDRTASRSKPRQDRFEFRGIGDRIDIDLDSHLAGHSLRRFVVEMSVRPGLGAENEGDAFGLWRDLGQQREPFRADRSFQISEAGDVAAGVRQALNETLIDGLGDQDEDDGHGARRLLQRLHARAAGRQDDVGRAGQKLAGRAAVPSRR
jgi:hypothetical protein